MIAHIGVCVSKLLLILLLQSLYFYFFARIIPGLRSNSTLDRIQTPHHGIVMHMSAVFKTHKRLGELMTAVTAKIIIKSLSLLGEP